MLTVCLRATDVDGLRPSQRAPLLQACASTLFPGVPTFQMDPSPRGSAPGRQSRKRKLTFLSFPGGGRRLPPDAPLLVCLERVASLEVYLLPKSSGHSLYGYSWG